LSRRGRGVQSVASRAFDRACAAVGRDPTTVRRSWGGGCACAPTRQEAERLAAVRGSAADDPDDFDLVGTPEQVLDQMRQFVALGVTYFGVDCGGFPALTTLETLITQVLPALNG
jgi:alkanesulfonate monooxygenase SsuD/methylene tetrahydromethanopterin reductase-like flavin-dependent oxidoreductase (luciferase family)